MAGLSSASQSHRPVPAIMPILCRAPQAQRIEPRKGADGKPGILRSDLGGDCVGSGWRRSAAPLIVATSRRIAPGPNSQLRVWGIRWRRQSCRRSGRRRTIQCSTCLLPLRFPLASPEPPRPESFPPRHGGEGYRYVDGNGDFKRLPVHVEQRRAIERLHGGCLGSLGRLGDRRTLGDRARPGHSDHV